MEDETKDSAADFNVGDMVQVDGDEKVYPIVGKEQGGTTLLLPTGPKSFEIDFMTREYYPKDVEYAGRASYFNTYMRGRAHEYDEHANKSLYRVAVNCEDCEIGPHRIGVTVVAESAHDALDRATEHSNAKELWDEPIQRSIANGEISDDRVERKYDGYIEEIEYAGDL